MKNKAESKKNCFISKMFELVNLMMQFKKKSGDA